MEIEYSNFFFKFHSRNENLILIKFKKIYHIIKYLDGRLKLKKKKQKKNHTHTHTLTLTNQLYNHSLKTLCFFSYQIDYIFHTFYILVWFLCLMTYQLSWVT